MAVEVVTFNVCDLAHVEMKAGLPQCVTRNFSLVAQSCPTLSDPVDCSPPGSSVYGIL